MSSTSKSLHTSSTQISLNLGSNMPQSCKRLTLYICSNGIRPIVRLYNGICIIPPWNHIKHQIFNYLLNAITTQSLLFSSAVAENQINFVIALECFSFYHRYCFALQQEVLTGKRIFPFKDPGSDPQY